MTVEKWLFAEDLHLRNEWRSSIQNNPFTHHRGKHTTQAPHIQAVIVFLEIDQQLGALEVPRGYSDIVLRLGVVKFGETPIDKSKLYTSCQVNGKSWWEFPYFSGFVIYHYVVWFNIAVHDAFGMTEIEGL